MFKVKNSLLFLRREQKTRRQHKQIRTYIPKKKTVETAYKNSEV